VNRRGKPTLFMEAREIFRKGRRSKIDKMLESFSGGVMLMPGRGKKKGRRFCCYFGTEGGEDTKVGPQEKGSFPCVKEEKKKGKKGHDFIDKRKQRRKQIADRGGRGVFCWGRGGANLFKKKKKKKRGFVATRMRPRLEGKRNYQGKKGTESLLLGKREGRLGGGGQKAGKTG